MIWGNAAVPPFGGRILSRPGAQKQKWEYVIRAEERLRERTRIARELHDGLLQGLLSATMQLSAAEERLAADSLSKPTLGRVMELMHSGIAEVRETLRGLRLAVPVGFSLGSFEKAFADFACQLTPTDQARLHIVMMGRPRPLSPQAREQVYLIAREALLNALRHSQATKIEVEVEYLRKNLRVVVRDNGSGFPARRRALKGSHWGLVGMRERAASIGARLRLWSKPGVGTEVEVSVPLGPGETTAASS
jgi:signal transduction histidine kinase